MRVTCGGSSAHLDLPASESNDDGALGARGTPAFRLGTAIGGGMRSGKRRTFQRSAEVRGSTGPEAASTAQAGRGNHPHPRERPVNRRADGPSQGPRVLVAKREHPARPALPDGELDRLSPEAPLSLQIPVRRRVLIRIGGTRCRDAGTMSAHRRPPLSNTDARSGAEVMRLDPFHPGWQEGFRPAPPGATINSGSPRARLGDQRGMHRVHGSANRFRRRSGGNIVPALVITHGVPSPLRRAVAASSKATTRLSISRGSTALASMLCGQTVSVAGPSSSSRLTSRRLRRFLPTREPRSQETLSRGSLPRENRDVPGLLSTGCASTTPAIAVALTRGDV